jgi:hypothetical protein
LIKNIEPKEGQMLISKRKLWATLLALTIVSIFAATSSPLLGAPVPGGPGFISIGNVSFQPHPPSVQYGYINGRLYNNNGSPASFVAPVSLPHGATITQFVLYYVDNDSVNDINAWIGYISLEESTVNVMCSITTSGGSPDARIMVNNTITTGKVIDNQSYNYFVSILLPTGSTSQLSGVRIDYSYPTNLPLIMK